MTKKIFIVSVNESDLAEDTLTAGQVLHAVLPVAEKVYNSNGCKYMGMDEISVKEFCEKAKTYGAKVVAMSDSNGCIYDKEGIDLDIIKDIKEVKRGRRQNKAAPGAPKGKTKNTKKLIYKANIIKKLLKAKFLNN